MEVRLLPAHQEFMITTVWQGQIESVGSVRIDLDYERSVGTPMTYTKYILEGSNERIPTIEENNLIQRSLESHALRLFAFINGDILPLPENTLPIMNALKKLCGNEWIKGAQN